MQTFVEFWVNLSATPLFGLTATVVVYVLAQSVSHRLNHQPLANPVLWTLAGLAALLMLTGTPYPTYFAGAQFIHFLLGPAVVALAWPLWKRRAELWQRWCSLLLAALVGGIAAGGTALAAGWALGLPAPVLASLAPKSITAPVAMGVAQQLGGIVTLAAVLAVLTGILGALLAQPLFDLLRVQSPEVRGFAIGTVSHGIGTARAMQVHPAAGAYAGLALSLQVVLAAVLLPAVLLLISP